MSRGRHDHPARESTDRMVDDSERPHLLTRREFFPVAGALGLTSVMSQRQRAAERLAYVGTYTTDSRSEGIYILRVHPETGALRVQGLAAKSMNPSYLTLHGNGRVLYAVNEVSEFLGQSSGGVSAFRVDRGTGRLTPINQQASQGEAPCYVSLDRTNRFVLVANYVSGSVATLPVRGDGGLEIAGSVIQHRGTGPHATRQTGPHAHCILPDPANRHVLVVDLGIDAVVSYELDGRTGKLTPVSSGAALKPGAGPRHLVFHPTLPFAYVANELDSTVSAFRYAPERGALDEVHTTAASPGGSTPDNHPADVHVGPTGSHLYLSNRGDDTIAVFAIDPSTGRLTPEQQIPCGGHWPRNFALDPAGRFLLVANQRSDSIVVFRIESGRLTQTAHRVELPVPVCIRFV
jgi:6-phosphogluconolactonase